MELQILVPRYNEPSEIIKGLLDSIVNQRSIDKDNFEIIICDDGSKECPLENIISTLESYKDKINIRWIKNEENKGISYTRNRLMNEATAEYIMWCDADDMFCSILGIRTILENIKISHFDILNSYFYEEAYTTDTNELVYLLIEDDSTFVHGKVYRKQFLLDNKLIWPEDIKINEDTYFNRMAQKLCKNDKLIVYKHPFYLWCNNPNSVTRKQKNISISSYPDLIKATEMLIKESIVRDLSTLEVAIEVVLMLILAYFNFVNFKKDKSLDKNIVKSTEKMVANFYRKYKAYWDFVSKEDKKDLINLMYNKGNALMLNMNYGKMYSGNSNVFEIEGWLGWLLIKYPEK